MLQVWCQLLEAVADESQHLEGEARKVCFQVGFLVVHHGFFGILTEWDLHGYTLRSLVIVIYGSIYIASLPRVIRGVGHSPFRSGRCPEEKSEGAGGALVALRVAVDVWRKPPLVVKDGNGQIL